MKSPIRQIIEQIDAEGRIVFQSNLLAGYSPRQALYNAYGYGASGTEVDCFPNGKYLIASFIVDRKLIDLFIDVPDKEIEAAFWEVVENERS